MRVAELHKIIVQGVAEITGICCKRVCHILAQELVVKNFVQTECRIRSSVTETWKVARNIQHKLRTSVFAYKCLRKIVKKLLLGRMSDEELHWEKFNKTQRDKHFSGIQLERETRLGDMAEVSDQRVPWRK